MNTEEMLVKIAENEQKVFEAGKQKAYDEFWDVFQDKGNRRVYYMAFQAGMMYPNGYWDDRKGSYNPKYPIVCSGNDYSARAIFENNHGIRNTLVTIDCSASSVMNYTFKAAGELITIPLLIVGEQTTYVDTFYNCGKLKDITFEGVIGNSISFNASPLTTKSIVNIIEHLSDNASGKTLTLKQTAVNAMTFPFTSEQSGITYTSWDNKGDETSLVNAKPNWEISLL